MAIIYGKGTRVTACRNLLARSDVRDMQIFVLHDADIDGYNIARTLGEATRRMPDHNVEVIDLGLTVPQAIEDGLETEEFTRRKSLPADLDSTKTRSNGSAASRIRAGDGKTHHECTRCELNAFSSDGLAEFIEAGLARHGVNPKLVPPPDVLAEHVQAVRDEALTEMVWAEIADMVDIDAIVAPTSPIVQIWPTSMRPASAPPSPTTRPGRGGQAAEQLVNEDIDATPGLAEAVRVQLAEQLATPQDHEE